MKQAGKATNNVTAMIYLGERLVYDMDGKGFLQKKMGFELIERVM